MSGAFQRPTFSPRRNWMSALCVAIGGMVGCAAFPNAARGESTDAIAKKMFAAWAKRQKQFRTVRAVVAADSNTKNKVFLPHASSSHSQKPVSYSTSGTRTIMLDLVHNRQRYEVRGGIYNVKLGRVVDRESVTVVRDGERKTFSNSAAFREQGLAPSGQGIMSDAKDFSFTISNIRPLLWYVCPLGAKIPGISYFNPRKDLAVVGYSRAGKVTLIECRETRSTSGGRVWIDPQKGYVIVRIRGNAQEVTIDYTRHPQFQYVPHRWTAVLFTREGAIRQSTSCIVSDLRFNESMDASVFDVDFPKGAVVVHTGKGNRGVPTMIATGTGGLTPLKSTSQPTRAIWRWLLICNALLVTVLAAYLLRSRIKRIMVRIRGV